MEMWAKMQAWMLSAFASMAYDTPGYGHAARDEDGTPTLMRMGTRSSDLMGLSSLPGFF